MLDIGWAELFLIAVLMLIRVGPKELPSMVRSVAGIVRKIRGLAVEFRSNLQDLADIADLDDIKKEIQRTSEWHNRDVVQTEADPDNIIKAENSSLSKYHREIEGPREILNQDNFDLLNTAEVSAERRDLYPEDQSKLEAMVDVKDKLENNNKSS